MDFEMASITKVAENVSDNEEAEAPRDTAKWSLSTDMAAIHSKV